MDELKQVDHYLMRKIVGSHSKIPIEFVYQAQKENPVQGDWVNMVKEDLATLNMTLEEDDIKSRTKDAFKKLVKEKMVEHAFMYYKEKQTTLSKVKDIVYEKLQIQSYMTNPMFTNEEVSKLFNIQASFKSINTANMQCKMGCADAEVIINHSLECQKIEANKKEPHTTFSDAFADIDAQKRAIQKFMKVESERDAAGSLPGPGSGHAHASRTSPASSAGRARD